MEKTITRYIIYNGMLFIQELEVISRTQNKINVKQYYKAPFIKDYEKYGTGNGNTSVVVFPECLNRVTSVNGCQGRPIPTADIEIFLESDRDATRAKAGALAAEYFFNRTKDIERWYHVYTNAGIEAQACIKEL